MKSQIEGNLPLMSHAAWKAMIVPKPGCPTIGEPRDSVQWEAFMLMAGAHIQNSGMYWSWTWTWGPRSGEVKTTLVALRSLDGTWAVSTNAVNGDYFQVISGLSRGELELAHFDQDKHYASDANRIRYQRR